MFVEPVSARSTAYFRIGIGLLIAISQLRFLANGWVEKLYGMPTYFFKYTGFEWVVVPSIEVLYALISLLILASLAVMFGFYYRLAIVVCFFLFTYMELMAKSYYLNHYYFVSLVLFLLCFIPAHRALSIDLKQGRCKNTSETIPFLCVFLLRFQLGVVYFFAGFAKLNSDWLFNAQPMSIWLQRFTDWPVVGNLLSFEWTAYLFSYFGAFYDLTISFFLLIKRTRITAYITVIIFHLATAILFNIGMFPWVMMTLTLIFFNPAMGAVEKNGKSTIYVLMPTLLTAVILYCLLQITLPLRYLLNNGNVLWTENGYRFSWRVMLTEKTGFIEFKVVDKEGREYLEIPRTYLSSYQEKMMSTQADMIYSYAKFLEKKFREKGVKDVKVYATSIVSLNGRSSQIFIDSTQNLLDERSIYSKIVPLNEQ